MSFDDELERGWDLLEAGDEPAARRLAERLYGDDPGHPDVLLLQAACCRQTGAIVEALQLLEQAAQADLNWAAPEIWIAEILAEDPERWSEALQHAAAALDRAEEEDEFLEALALKAGLEIDVGKPTAARKTLAELPPLHAGAAVPPALALDFAHLFLEVGDVDEATRRFQAMVDADGRDADAWHGLGLCAEARDDEAGKRQAWLRVLALDAEKPLAASLLSEVQMAEVAEATLRELPRRVRELIAHVPILIVDLPARDEVDQGLDPRLLGMFAGSPYSDPSMMGGQPQLTQILLFRKNLERAAHSVEELREQIRITLLHETGHFFGMSEEDLAEVGLE
ncbi:MAG: metallopeptidase family protein [Polyangia bacterium]|jgi:predicted Zn-dependent protease with MMP-like domain